MASDTVGQLKIGLTFDTKELNASMQSAETSANKAGGAMQVAFGTLAANAIQSVIGKVGNLASSIINTGMGFEASMSNVAAISGATGDDLAALTAKAREMGANTKFSASQASDALSYMAMAGWKTNQMLDGLEGIMNLAAASGADLASASDIVTDALTGFGEGADQAGRLADIMAAASSNANTNVELMGETFKYVTPIAGSLGYSMEDTALAIGLMANAGVKGSQAGTSLRSIMQRLATNVSGCQADLEKLGIEVVNSDGSMRDFGDVIVDLRGVFKDLTSEQQAEIAKTVAGTEAMSGFLAIVNSGDEDFAKLTGAINDSEGAAAEIAKTMQDNLQGRLTTLNSKLEELQIKLFDAVKPALEAGVALASGFADALSWVMDNADVVIPVLGALTAGVTAYVAVTKGATIVSKAWTAATNVAKAAQLALNVVLKANPIGLIVAAVTALITGVVLLYNKCEPFREFVNVVFGKVGEFFGWLGGKIAEIPQWVASAANAIGNFFGAIATNISNFFGGIANAIGEFFGEAARIVQDVVTTVSDFFVSAWDTVIGVLEGVGEWFAEVFAVPIAIAEKFVEIIVKIGEILYTLAYVIAANVAQFIVSIFQPVWDFFQTAITSVSEWFSALWSAIVVGVTAVGEWFASLWQSLMDGLTAIGEFFSMVFDTIWSAIDTVVTNVRAAFQGAWDFITGVFGKVGQWFKDRFTEVYNNIKAVFASVGDFFKGVYDNVVKVFTSIGEAVGNGVKSALAAAINFVLSAVETVVNAGIDFINGLINGVNNLADLVGMHIEPLSHLQLGRVQFAKGGIVPGTDYNGDHIPALMNSGEMVLTRGQQGALWNAIESGELGQAAPAMPEPVTADVDVWARALSAAFEEAQEQPETDERPLELNQYFEVNSELDAENIGNIIGESIRRAA